MYKLIWQQDFTKPTAHLADWNIRIGNDLLDYDGNVICAGWGNGELQYYTGHNNNLFINEQGLNIRACVEEVIKDERKYAYTSARIDTRGHFAFCYGKLVIRAKLPIGQGLWPAIWLLPVDISAGAWPVSGEIDIMEAKGRLPHQVSGTLHYGQNIATKATDEFSYQLPEGSIAQFRDYALEWDVDSIRWIVDGYCYAERRIDRGGMPFDKPFYLVLNVAVGGWYDRVVVDDRSLPAEMTISHISCYQ